MFSATMRLESSKMAADGCEKFVDGILSVRYSTGVALLCDVSTCVALILGFGGETWCRPGSNTAQ